MPMNLLHKPTTELITILEEKKSKFDSYRINYVANDKELDSNELITSKEDDKATENKKVVFEVIKTNKEVPVNKDIEVASDDVKVVDLEKRVKNANTEATKTYNERMKSGFFGRRRSR